jgi:hypothetical protein
VTAVSDGGAVGSEEGSEDGGDNVGFDVGSADGSRVEGAVLDGRVESVIVGSTEG